MRSDRPSPAGTKPEAVPGSSREDGEQEPREQSGAGDLAGSSCGPAAESTLSDRMQSFLPRRWLGVLATVEDGTPSVRPCVGDPGMVRVLDRETVALPADRVLGDGPSLADPPGARRRSLLTVDWWDTTLGLHVDGVGGVRSTVDGRVNPLPSTGWITLSVEEARFHRARHLPRLSVADRPAARSTDVGEPAVTARMPDPVRRFVASRLLGFLGTADADGATDVAPRAGPPGFVQVRDGSTLAWPEPPHDRRAPLDNLRERPRASLLFADWWNGESIVQVSGATALRETVDWVDDPAAAERARRWVVMDVDRVETYRDPPLPRLGVEAFDPPWGADDPGVRRRGHLEEGPDAQ